jgi:hypothetical protein
MKKNLLLMSMLICLAICTNAQNNFWNSSDAFLGQTPPSDTPKTFAPGLLADSGIVLGRIAFSKDGKELYYGYARHWFDFNGTGIKQILYDGHKWNKPKVLTKDLATPTLSIDENKLFFAGQNSEVWQSEREKDGWSAPKLWLVKNCGLYDFQPTNSGVFYVGSNANAGSKKDYTSYDFCTLTITNKDTIINSLGSPLNTLHLMAIFMWRLMNHTSSSAPKKPALMNVNCGSAFEIMIKHGAILKVSGL